MIFCYEHMIVIFEIIMIKSYCHKSNLVENMILQREGLDLVSDYLHSRRLIYVIKNRIKFNVSLVNYLANNYPNLIYFK